ncbi:MAG: outer membrane beta-barrel protein [Candidatus Cyclobacteriaceae bacterium M3_2C_046]
MDHQKFFKWYKQLIEKNQVKPPSNSWEQISNQLDIEEVWQNVSGQLDRFDTFRRFEKFGLAMLTSILLLLIPFWPKQNHLSQTAKTENVITSNQESNHIPESANIPESNRHIPHKLNSIFPSENILAKRLASPFNNSVFIKPQAWLPSPEKQATQIKNLNPLENIFLKNNLTKNKTAIVIKKSEQHSVAPEESSTPLFNNYYIGFTTSVKNNWLINNTTIQGLDRYELNATRIDFGKELGVMAGGYLTEKLGVQWEGYVLSDMGQRYNEYLNGKYVRREINLNYFKSSLLVTYKLGHSQNITTTASNILAGIHGGILDSAEEIIDDFTEDVSDEYLDYDLGLVLGYEYEFSPFKNIQLSSGIRVNYGLINVYSGDEYIPADFRWTTTGSINFSLSAKYLFIKD